MDLHLQKLFQMQIWTQCRFAALAYGELTVQLADMDAAFERATTRYDDTLAELPHEELRARSIEIAMDSSVRTWQPIQAVLTAVANISKALWGQGGKLSVEREPLRVALGVADSSPLKPTTMRNNFDHFDEKLDQWWAKSTNQNYVDLSFGDVGSAIQGIPEEDMFRSYDPRSGDLVFWGQRYNLPSIMDEIERITPLALRASA